MGVGWDEVAEHCRFYTRFSATCLDEKGACFAKTGPRKNHPTRGGYSFASFKVQTPSSKWILFTEPGTTAHSAVSVCSVRTIRNQMHLPVGNIPRATVEQDFSLVHLSQNAAIVLVFTSDEIPKMIEVVLQATSIGSESSSRPLPDLRSEIPRRLGC